MSAGTYDTCYAWMGWTSEQDEQTVKRTVKHAGSWTHLHPNVTTCQLHQQRRNGSRTRANIDATLQTVTTDESQQIFCHLNPTELSRQVQ
jgi:hypothetical protein